MKKHVFLCDALGAVLMMTSCGTNKENAYRKAYEKAQAQEQAPVAAEPQETVVAPVVERPQNQPAVQDNYDNVAVRTENVSVVSGSGLKGFSVVVGSFGLKTNAEGLQQRLINSGYNAQIVFNSSNQMYRVVASTFETKGEAVSSRDALRSQYADAWLLYSK